VRSLYVVLTTRSFFYVDVDELHQDDDTTAEQPTAKETAPAAVSGAKDEVAQALLGKRTSPKSPKRSREEDAVADVPNVKDTDLRESRVDHHQWFVLMSSCSQPNQNVFEQPKRSFFHYVASSARQRRSLSSCSLCHLAPSPVAFTALLQAPHALRWEQGPRDVLTARWASSHPLDLGSV
jgi:hypothetical protein